MLNHPDLVLIQPNELQGKWKSIFNNENPIYIEVGMGKGQFIIENAKRFPNINFLGIERFDNVMVKALDKLLLEDKLPNLRFVLIDATFINDFFDNDEISRIYLNFSDPWPKARHEKRRLTSQSFLKKYQDILQKDGIIQFKTDNFDLFEYSVESFNNYKMKLLEVNRDLHNNTDDLNIMTEYEEKFSSMGNKIYRLTAKFGG